MTIILSHAQSQEWDQGGWLSLEIQEDLVEDIQRQHITEEVVVQTETGVLCFALTPQKIRKTYRQ